MSLPRVDQLLTILRTHFSRVQSPDSTHQLSPPSLWTANFDVLCCFAPCDCTAMFSQNRASSHVVSRIL